MMALSGRIESDLALMRYRQLLRQQSFKVCPAIEREDRTATAKMRTRNEVIRRLADATR
jgi:hypothetical protein